MSVSTLSLRTVIHCVERAGTDSSGEGRHDRCRGSGSSLAKDFGIAPYAPMASSVREVGRKVVIRLAAEDASTAR